MILVVAAVVIAGVVWLTRSNAAAAAAHKIAVAALAQAEVHLPTIRVDVIDGVASLGKPGLVRITSDQVLSVPLMIRGVCQGLPAV